MKARADHFSFKGYMYGRIKRIMIPYLFIILLIYLTIPHGESTPRHMKANHDVIFAYCPTTLPLSFLLLNNFIGFGGCGLHLWSISVQMHLYVLFGLIIKVLPRDPRKRMPKLMKIAGCSFILCSAVRLALGLFYQIEIPVPAFGHQNLSEKSKGDAFRFYHTMYFLTTSRLCNFMAGVLLAASMDTASMAKLHRIRPRWIISSTAIIFYYNIVTSIKYNQEPMRPWRFSPVWASLVFHGSPLASLLFALLLCCCVMHERPQSWMATGYIYQVMKYLSGVRIFTILHVSWPHDT